MGNQNVTFNDFSDDLFSRIERDLKAEEEVNVRDTEIKHDNGSRLVGKMSESVFGAQALVDYRELSIQLAQIHRDRMTFIVTVGDEADELKFSTDETVEDISESVVDMLRDVIQSFD